MSDIDRGLPVRTEDDLHEKVQVKISDAVDPNGVDKQAEVSEKLAHVRVFGADEAGTKVQLQLSQDGRPNSNGEYDATENTNPSSNGDVAHSRVVAEPTEVDQIKRITAAVYDDGIKTVVSKDVSIHDENGVPYNANNPLPITMEATEQDTVHSFAEKVIAADGNDIHTYSVVDGKTMILKQVISRASGRMKAEVEIGDGAATEVFSKYFVGFESEDQGVGCDYCPSVPHEVVGTATGTTVKVTLHNRDNKDTQSLYSTIVGYLKNTTIA